MDVNAGSEEAVRLKRFATSCVVAQGIAAPPSEFPPRRLDEDGWQKEKLFRPPFPVYSDLLPLVGSNPVGKFVAEALIDEAGCVRQVKILQSPNRSLDAAAVATFEKWAYLPATQNHRPVRVIETLTLNFPPDEPWVFRDRMIDD